MARFKYLGEPPRSYVVAYGPCTSIKVPSKAGTQTLTPVVPATSFVVGNDIGHEITDELALMALRADSARYQEIV